MRIYCFGINLIFTSVIIFAGMVLRVKTNIKGRNETRLALWEERLKDPIVALDKALKCEWKMCIRGLGPSARRKECVAMAGVASSKVCG